MAITVLVPHDDGRAALADIPGVRALRYDVEQLDIEEPLDADQRAAEVLVPDFLSSPALRRLFGELPRLELVQLLSAGADPWLPVLPDGVALSTARGAHGGSTAEWVLASLLSTYRRLGEFERDRQRQVWQQRRTETLQGKRVLVVGAGDLGREIRRRLDAFDAVTTLVATTPRDGVRGVDELPALLPDHDAAVLVVPLTGATRRMADANFLAAMSDGAVLVNAARGPVVDTDALVAELSSGRLRAALDVTDPEPLPPGHPLWTAPNLLLTPHVGGSVDGLVERAWRVAAAEIGRYAAGQRPHNLVTGDY